MKTKKFLCVISLVLTLLSMFSMVSFALTTGTVKGSDGSMNMRNGPGTSHKLVVTVPNGTSVTINGSYKCDDGSTSSNWYNVTCKVNGKEYTGYIASSGISNIKDDSSGSGYTLGISDAVPDIYLDSINKLKKAHPNWTFKFYYTGLDWYDVIKNETKPKANSIDGNAYPISYRSTSVYFTPADNINTDESTGIINGSDGSLNMRDGPGTKHNLILALKNGTTVTIIDTVSCDDGTTSGQWYKIKVTVDGKSYTGYVASNRVTTSGTSNSSSYTPVEGSSWFQAHGQVVSYYIDPRNFLNESNIFQFEELTYNSNVQNLKGVQAILKGSFMDGTKITTDDGRSITYAEAFMEAGKKSNVSPYHLASKVLQEVGKSGSKSTSGTNPNYPVYNFYNIGAYTGYLDGLKWAYNGGESGSYGRPWTTQYKSIIGGAKYISEGYIAKGQNTIYFEKFDFINDGGLYSHQYAADVTYSKVQAVKIYDSVYKNILSTDFCFVIPVFRNVPKTACALPKSSGQPNMAPDCPKFTDTVDPKPTSTSGNGTTNPFDPIFPPTIDDPSNNNAIITIVKDPNCGDVNQDKKVSVADAKLVLKYVAKKATFSDKQKLYADLNGDGKVTVVDAKWILQVVAKLRDLKVESDASNLSVAKVSTSAYSFEMPAGWEFNKEYNAFFKLNTNKNCYVKIDDLGTEDSKYYYTLDNLFTQGYSEVCERADTINKANDKNSATATKSTLKLANGSNAQCYQYLTYDADKNVTDSVFVAFFFINKNIYCVSYICQNGTGYDKNFDFSKQLTEKFIIK